MFARIQKKRTQKQAQKDMNQKEWHKMDYLIFSAMRMRKRHLFCISSHHNALSEKQPELNKGARVFARARAQLLNMLYNSPRLSVPHGENI